MGHRIDPLLYVYLSGTLEGNQISGEVISLETQFLDHWSVHTAAKTRCPMFQTAAGLVSQGFQIGSGLGGVTLTLMLFLAPRTTAFY